MTTISGFEDSKVLIQEVQYTMADGQNASSCDPLTSTLIPNTILFGKLETF